MSEAQTKFWNTTQFYKGYLPVKDSLVAQAYVILASNTDPSAWPSKGSADSATSSPGPHSSGTPGNSPKPVRSATPAEDVIRDSGDFAEFTRSSVQESDAGSHEGFHHNPSQSRVSFYLYRKRDVSPPPLKYTLSSKQVNHCFFVCEKPNCCCECPHVKPGVWRLRVDVLRRTSVTVSEKGQNRRLMQREVVPTAGYFFALGLLHMKAVQAVVPTMCRFNKDCRNGCMCLYIHADVSPRPSTRHAADIRLRDWSGNFVLDALNGSEEEQTQFFNFLDDEGIVTVGDLQVLGIPAFESLANSVRPEWAEAFLITSILRNFDRKYSLEDALATFPRVNYPLRLPESLKTVGDLLNTPSSVFYHLDLAPHVMDALEIIRNRYESDEAYNVITLAKEPADSFFVRITAIINQFRGRHAHNSWRKHDPTRPVVTSAITYVDVTQCRCSPDELAPDDAPFTDEMPSVELPPVAPDQEVGCPRRSWCQCPRRWEIAVNYELSTPSGSRCSEQNVMGKLAALGVPTWAVRDVIVHGKNVKKEANPLFPCGVCENMLQKVNKDVESQYGGDVTLYMFDATEPKKIVYLPVQEISHRDGLNFKKFVAQDLRS